MRKGSAPKHGFFAALLIIMSMLSGALVACAHQLSTAKPKIVTTHSEGPLPPSAQGADLPIDWSSSPIINGQLVPSLSAAAADLTFTPEVPPSFQAPVQTLVTAPGNSRPDSRSVAFVFQDPSYGLVWLIEQRSETNQAEIEALATTCDPSQGCDGTWSLVALNNGTNALSISGPQSNGVIWLSNGVMFDVLGPPGTFTNAAALAVANSIP